jgi:hypothetical protein
MAYPSFRSVSLRMGLLALAATACRGRTFEAPPPSASSVAVLESLPPVPPSRLELPVRYDLGPALAWLESEVPQHFGSLEERIALPDNERVHIAYAITREPFRVTLEGQTATVSSILHYEGQGWYNAPVLPEVSASCGSGEQRPRARLTLRMRIRVSDRWMLEPNSTVRAEPLTGTERDQCRVTVLSIDVTEKVLRAAEAALQGELKKVDRRLRAFPLRAEVEAVWRDMQKPIRLTDSLWLLINPVSVRYLPPTTVGDTLVWQAGLDASPRIFGGARPGATTQPLLPPDRKPPPPPTLRIQSEGRLPYDVAEAILTKALRGKEIAIGGRTLVIQHLMPIPLGDGRVAVGLTVTGAAQGTLYAVGRPQVDSTGRLTMPDLVLDAGTTGALTGALAWIASTDAVQQFLREAVTVDLAPVIDKGRLLAEKNLNRDLAPGVALRTTLSSAVPVGVWAARDALVARIVVRGEGAIAITLYLPGESPPDSTPQTSTP